MRQRYVSLVALCEMRIGLPGAAGPEKVFIAFVGVPTVPNLNGHQISLAATDRRSLLDRCMNLCNLGQQ